MRVSDHELDAGTVPIVHHSQTLPLTLLVAPVPDLLPRAEPFLEAVDCVYLRNFHGTGHRHFPKCAHRS